LVGESGQGAARCGERLGGSGGGGGHGLGRRGRPLGAAGAARGGWGGEIRAVEARRTVAACREQRLASGGRRSRNAWGQANRDARRHVSTDSQPRRIRAPQPRFGAKPRGVEQVWTVGVWGDLPIDSLSTGPTVPGGRKTVKRSDLSGPRNGTHGPPRWGARGAPLRAGRGGRRRRARLARPACHLRASGRGPPRPGRRGRSNHPARSGASSGDDRGAPRGGPR
jgi:hypothetical protein